MQIVVITCGMHNVTMLVNVLAEYEYINKKPFQGELRERIHTVSGKRVDDSDKRTRQKRMEQKTFNPNKQQTSGSQFENKLCGKAKLLVNTIESAMFHPTTSKVVRYVTSP